MYRGLLVICYFLHFGRSSRPDMPAHKQNVEEDPCGLPPDTGRCRENLNRWFYNPAVGSCQTFTWGGCGGNGNKFNSEKECEATCKSQAEGLDPTGLNDTQHLEEGDPCELPPDVGMCKAALDRWFYNPAVGSCHTFTWGGCGGNGNNFNSEKECEATCKSPGEDLNSREVDITLSERATDCTEQAIYDVSRKQQIAFISKDFEAFAAIFAADAIVDRNGYLPIRGRKAMITLGSQLSAIKPPYVEPVITEVQLMGDKWAMVRQINYFYTNQTKAELVLDQGTRALCVLECFPRVGWLISRISFTNDVNPQQ